MSLTTMSQGGAPVYYEEEESQSGRIARKSKEFPFLPAAIGLCAITCAYGAYMYKRRGKMSTSVYLMQLRVAAQGLAVGSITVGLAYTMIKENLLNSDEEKRE